MFILVIIPTSGNSASLTYLKRSINSIVLSAHLAKVKVKIYIITDNSSARVDLLDVQIDNFLLVDSSLGFSEKNNVAVFESLNFFNPDYFLFINDDAWIDKSFFVNFKKIRNADIINPLIYTSGKKIIDSFGVEYFRSGYAKNANLAEVPTQLATAACMLVKTSLVKRMQRSYGFVFNPIYHYYLEDVDFCLRALGVGARIAKFQYLRAYHIGSATSGQKSYFTMYHTYRNILWLILITWPRKTILYHLKNILLVQMWTILYSTFQQSPLLYLKIAIDTARFFNKIRNYRERTLNGYRANFNFEKVFSNLTFRTYHGYKIKI
jgi:GT2 family glycosyltransferase